MVPLAYMRGRTINSAFVILDEAQNATPMQMKMFLTRLGAGSKAIITGDQTQIDLPSRTNRELYKFKMSSGVEGIRFVYFNKGDVVRHKLVMDIIDAYEKFHSFPSHSSEEEKATERETHASQTGREIKKSMEIFHFGFLTVTWMDVVDVLLVAFLFYRLYVAMRGTIAAQIFLGLLIVIAGSLIARIADMKALSWLLKTLTDIWVIALIVIISAGTSAAFTVFGEKSSY